MNAASVLEAPQVSVVLCTYNRCDLLPTALASLAAQRTGGVRFEVIVVDNNSTDATRDVVERERAAGTAPLRYLFEPKQGLSHARNAGVAAARASIVAFTDDDVTATPEWIATLHAAFQDPAIACIGGKVLPVWPAPPPAWLTQLHWSPLALVDRGDLPLVADASNPLVFVGANLAVRRDLFDAVGGFDADLQRVKDGIGSTEDHEFLLRAYHAGYRGRYVPSLVMYAPVQDDRLQKRYHRRWHAGHGRFMARMNLVKPDPGAPTLFELPSYYYGNVAREAGSMLKALVSGRSHDAFWHELQFRSGLQLIGAMRRLHPRNGNGTLEAIRFATGLLRKKWASRRSVLP